MSYTYHGDPQVYAPVREEPVSEGALSRHHMRIRTGLLRTALMLGQRRAIRPVFAAKARRM